MAPKKTPERIDTWGTRFWQRRTQLGLSQVQVSRVTGLTQQTISRFERDEIVPRLETLERYARACGTTVEELFPMSLRPKGPSRAAEEGRRAKRRNGRGRC